MTEYDQSNDTATSNIDSAKTERRLLLSERMHLATKDVHDQSDKKVNYKLAMVLVSKELYAEAISLFWPVYREIEDQLERHADHPQLGLLRPFLGILRRTERFESSVKGLQMAPQRNTGVFISE